MNLEKDKKYAAKRWVNCPIEEHYFGDERKSHKMARKLASAKDRSKYKKSNRDQRLKAEKIKKEPLSDSLIRGRVITIVPEGIIVESDHLTYTCLLRGVLKKEKGLLKNLVTVGDYVLFEIISPGEGSISYVEPRKTILSRADNLSRRKEQLIASNIDQVIITASVVSPLLKPTLLDRYIIAARKGGLDAVIVINKIDLLEDGTIEDVIRQNEKELCYHLLEVYQKNQIPVIAVSIKTEEGLEALRKAMENKTSVFSGQSGVGKSSLINAVTGLSLRVGTVVERTQKGSHTTTTTSLLPLDFGGWCVDTPGIKSFGVWDLKPDEIENYFTEIHAVGHQCHFPDCSHSHEEDCAVMQAVEKGEISIIRYNSYLALMAEAASTHLRR